MGRSVQRSCGVLAMGMASMAVADVALLTQQRSITAATTSNGNSQTVAAADFAPFVRSLNLSTTFIGPTGPVTNVAISRIDCQIDPNAIRAFGNLTGAGGQIASTGETEIGDAKAAILVTFQVGSPVPFNLVAAQRPDLHPTDDFIIELKDLTRNVRLFVLDQSDPPQAVDVSGTLQPGQYSMKYRVEATFDGTENSRAFNFNLSLGCRADFNGVDGVSVQDIFDFLSAWFAADQRADFDGSGTITVQDIMDFMNAWFAGCA